MQGMGVVWPTVDKRYAVLTRARRRKSDLYDQLIRAALQGPEMGRLRFRNWSLSRIFCILAVAGLDSDSKTFVKPD